MIANAYKRISCVTFNIDGLFSFCHKLNLKVERKHDMRSNLILSTFNKSENHISSRR